MCLHSGMGGEHDASMLRAIADAGSGLFYYINNVDCIPDSFCDCLGGLLSVSAQVINVKYLYESLSELLLCSC